MSTQLPTFEIGSKINKEFVSALKNSLVDNQDYSVGDMNVVIDDSNLYINGHCCIGGYDVQINNGVIKLADLLLNSSGSVFLALVLHKDTLEDEQPQGETYKVFKGVSAEISTTPFVNNEEPFLILGYIINIDEYIKFIKINNNPVTMNNMVVDSDILENNSIINNNTGKNKLTLNELFDNGCLILDDGRISDSYNDNIVLSYIAESHLDPNIIIE